MDDFATQISALEPTPFERLVNDLLHAEYGTAGQFIPFDTSAGVTDGGFDAYFAGELDGLTGKWGVSAKRTTAENLAGLLWPDVARHPGRQWWVVTSASVPPDAHVRKKLARLAPGSRIDGLERVAQLARTHRVVARWHGLGDGHGDDILRRVDPTAPAPLLPGSQRDVPAQIAQALGDSRAVAIVAPLGSGAPDWCAATALHLRGRGRAPFPVLVHASTSDRLSALTTAIRQELRIDERRYSFVVPPSRQAGRIVESVAELAGGHEIVAFLTPLQRTEVRGRVGLVDIRPPEPTPDEIAAWIEEGWASRGLRHDQVAAMVSLAGRRAGVARALVDGEADDLADDVRDAVEAILGSDRRAERERALGLLVLLSPMDRGVTEAERTEVVIVARETGQTTGNVASLLRRAVREELLVEERGSIVEPSVILSARLLQSWLEDEDCDAFVRGLDGQIQWRAALHIARLAHRPAPLVRLLREATKAIPSLEIEELPETLKRAQVAAFWSADLAAEVLNLARAGLASVRSMSATSPDSFAPYRIHGMVSVLGAMLVAVARWRAHARAAVTALAELPTNGAAPPRFEELGKKLVDPGNPDPEATRRVMEALGELEGSAAFDLLLGAAQVVLGDRAQVTSSVGWTVRWSRPAWADIPELRESRRLCVEALLRRATPPPPRDVRARAWKALRGTWKGTPLPKRPAAPDDVRALWSRIADLAEATLHSTSWPDAADAEEILLGTTAGMVLGRDRIVAAIRDFSREPAYLLWRSLFYRSGLLDDSLALAAQIEAGAGWKEVVARFVKYDRHVWQPALAARLNDAAPTPATALEALRRVAEPEDVQWGNTDVLREWVSLAPGTFEPLLFGAISPQVPQKLRAPLLHAALPTFGERLRSLMAGPVVASDTLALALALARVGQQPEQVPEDEIVALAPIVTTLVDHENRAALFLALAAHPAPGARWRIAQLFADWVLYEERKPDPRDARAVADRLVTGGPAGLTALQALLHAWYGVPDPATDLEVSMRAAIGWGCIAHIREPKLGDVETIRSFVRFAATEYPERWLDLVGANLDMTDSGLVPTIPDAEVVRRVLARVPAGPGPWSAVLERAATGLVPAEAIPLARERVASDPYNAAVLLSTCVTPMDEAWLQVAGAAVLAAPSVEDVLLDGAMSGSLNRIYARQGPHPLQQSLEEWRRAASIPGAPAFASRIADTLARAISSWPHG